MNLRLHHVGIAVADIAWATEDHRARLGSEPVGGPFHDAVQTAYIQFLRFPGDGTLIELVAPDGPDSKLQAAVRKGGGVNHVCYSADDIDEACRSLGERGMFLISGPTPAVAFGGLRIAWLMGPDRVLTELVERGDDPQGIAHRRDPGGRPVRLAFPGPGVDV